MTATAQEPECWRSFQCACGAILDIRLKEATVDVAFICVQCGKAMSFRCKYPVSEAGYGSTADREGCVEILKGILQANEARTSRSWVTKADSDFESALRLASEQLKGL